MAADAVLSDDVHVDSFGDALLASLVMAAVSDRAAGDPRHERRRRVHAARDEAHRAPAGRDRADRRARDHLPRDRRARAAGAARRDARRQRARRWRAGSPQDGYQLAEWETDLSSQTGASQAGILLGSNEDIPAFRWVEKERRADDGLLLAGGLRRDRAPPRDRHRPARRRRLQPRQPALGRGRRGDPHREPLGGREAREPRLPGVLRQRVQRHARARAVLLGGPPRGDRGAARGAPRRPAARAPRRHLPVHARGDVRDRARPGRVRRAHGHDARAPRGVRDVRALRRGGAPLRARCGRTRWRRCASSTSSSARIARARRYAPRPYEIVVLSDHGQTQGATFKQRNGYGLDELVERSLRRLAGRRRSPAATSRTRWCSTRSTRRPAARQRRSREERRLRSRRRRARLGQPRARLPDGGAAPADARGDRGAPPASCSRRCASTRTSAGCSCARPSTAPSCWAATATNYLDEQRVEGEDPLAHFSPTAAQHLLRTDGFAHVADIMIGSFYDPMLDEGCAFEELISFHGGLGGPQTRAVHPAPRATCRCRTSRCSARPRSTACSRAGGRRCSPRRRRRSSVLPLDHEPLRLVAVARALQRPAALQLARRRARRRGGPRRGRS